MSVAPPSTDWLIDYTPLRSLPLDQEALRIFDYAYRVGTKTEPTGLPRVTFTSLLIALLEGEDETSRWFAKLATTIGPLPDKVFREKSFTKVMLEEEPAVPLGIENPPVLSQDKQLLTVSAHEVLQKAEQRASQVGGSDIGVRHLIASYVLNPPPNHRAQMQRWEFQESRWRSEFFPWIASRYTAEQWIDASSRPAPSQAIPAFEQPEISGAALAFPGDEDTLMILQTASELHTLRRDPWLRLQTVFYALVDQARKSTHIGAIIQPICDAVLADVANYESVREKFFNAPLAEHPANSFADLNLSPRVLNALETARELAAATWRDEGGEFRVGALHLAGALISRRVDSDVELSLLGLNPHELRLSLIAHAHGLHESVEAWREALGEEESLPSGRPIDLNSDEPEAVVRLDEDWRNDPLLIRPDVETFAALLASQHLEPPLSIGLFGPWGSGKTTFLRRLQRAVKRRADEAKSANENSQPTSYVSNVVHVDFNAWHFAEGALTSSLVDTILRALSSYINDEKPEFGKAWSKLKQEQLETTKRTLEATEAVKRVAENAVKDAESKLSDALSNAASTATSLQALVNGVWTTARNELSNSAVVKKSGVLEAVGNTVRSSKELETKLDSIRTRPARLLTDLGLVGTLMFAAMVLILPPLIAYLVKRYMGGQGVQETLSMITTIVVVLGGWIRSATKAVSKVDLAIAEVAGKYETLLANDPGVQTAKKDLELKQISATTAEAAVQAAREALIKAQAEAVNASLPAQMLQLVSSRIDDKSYGRELTTLSLARADLQALSLILRDQGKNKTQPSQDGNHEAGSPTRAVDRVILYIDDLDRCKPEDVVRVLQLVHMLLAFELFVVVVAVDARWIEESLRDSYKWLAGEPSSNGETQQRPTLGRVTPQDYLEKIFQISFWLEPMTSARAARYLESLVRTKVQESDPESGLPTPPDGKIDIASIELDYMRALAKYVGPSPRRVKRLVNAYRLIKARLSDSQLEQFLTSRATEAGEPKSGPYQLVIGLLVIGTGAPITSAQILKELAECDPTDNPDEVVTRFSERNHLDWTMSAKVIETMMRTQKSKDVSELRGWARHVGRFLLNSPTGITAL